MRPFPAQAPSDEEDMQAERVEASIEAVRHAMVAEWIRKPRLLDYRCVQPRGVAPAGGAAGAKIGEAGEDGAH
jgi:hypothetical protein